MPYNFTLCWDCERSYKKTCNWAKDFKPVDGWDADETKNGYLVKSCPEFIRDSRDFGMRRLEKENGNEQADYNREPDERS